MTFDANRLNFFTLFLCKIFTAEKVRREENNNYFF